MLEGKQQKQDELKNRVRYLSPELASTWLIALRASILSVGLLGSSLMLASYSIEQALASKTLFTTFALLFLANGSFALWTRYSRTSDCRGAYNP